MNWQYLPAHHTAKSVGHADTQPVNLVALNRMLVASGGQPVQPSWVSSSGRYGAPEPRPVPQLPPRPPPAPRRRRRWPVAVALAAVVAVLAGMAAAVATSPAMARSISAIADPGPSPGPRPGRGPGRQPARRTARRQDHQPGDLPGDRLRAGRGVGPQLRHPGRLPDRRGLPAAGVARLDLPYSADASWYTINAQLDNGIGDITTEVIFRKITRYSDGSRKVADRVAATGHVAGGYGIASAQWNR